MSYVIVKNKLLEGMDDKHTPVMLSYPMAKQHNSNWNTGSIFGVYLSGVFTDWI